MSDTRCPVCDDDGWIDVLDDDGFPVGARDCPRLDDPGLRTGAPMTFVHFDEVPSAGSDGEDRPATEEKTDE